MKSIITIFFLFGITFMPPDVFSDALCANKKTGSVRYSPSCKNGVEISIQQGQQGPAGPQGPKGDAGIPGGLPGGVIVSDCRPYSNSFHKYKFIHTSAQVGSTVNVGGKDFIIYKIPFYEFASGRHYALTFPSIANGTFVTLGASHSRDNVIADCSTDKINGFDVLFSHGDGMSYYVNKIPPLTGGPSFSIGRSSAVTIRIQVGDTLVTFSPESGSSHSVAKKILDTDYDMTGLMDWSQARDPIGEIQEAEQLANYVWVEAIP